jgi:hypothetical protein
MPDRNPDCPLAHALGDRQNAHPIDGADVAAGHDAERAIDQGARLAASFSFSRYRTCQ